MLHPVTEVIRPALRGVNHLIAFPISILAMLGLMWWANDGRDEWAALVFGASVSGVLGTSGFYHRVRWSPRLAIWVRRTDHAMIFLGLAGIYTSIWLSALHGRPIADVLLYVVWVGGAIGITFKMLWIDAPKLLGAGVYVALGLTGLLAIPELVAVAGLAAVIVMLASGLMMALGAIVYALEWPDPLPHAFGYHEIFHLFVTVGFALMYVSYAKWVLPH